MSYHEERFTTPDGLSVYGQRWLPEPPAGAVVVLVHGFVEHSGRYAPLAEDLNRQGYAVYAMDLRGHGRSEGPRCFVRRFDQYLEDLDLFLDRVAAAEPDKPLFLLGHSMGGLIVARWAISRPARQADLRGLILSGPALRVGRGLFPLLRHLAWIASLLAPRLPVVRLGGRRISRDPAVVEDFRRDPLVFHRSLSRADGGGNPGRHAFGRPQHGGVTLAALDLARHGRLRLRRRGQPATPPPRRLDR